VSEVRLAPDQEPMPLHAIWFNVVRPTKIVLQNGQPGFELVGAAETLAQATGIVRSIPGGRIVMQAVVFINPMTVPMAPRPS
jgi:hypothetical protein